MPLSLFRLAKDLRFFVKWTSVTRRGFEHVTMRHLLSVVDPRGGAPGACPPSDQIFLNFMQILGKFVCWRLPTGNLDPPLVIAVIVIV